MRELAQAREEFNSGMKDYTAMIVQTEHYPFSNNFFLKNNLILPNKIINYTPPAWVGVEYMDIVLDAVCNNKKPKKWREEIMPDLDSEKYLICDDACGEGNTFEIAMVRLVERDIRLENIWCIAQEGNREQREPLLEKGIEWHKYNIREGNLATILKWSGFNFPPLTIKI